MGAGFRMYGHDIRACCSEISDHAARILHHQVAVKHLVGDATDGAYDICSDRDGRYEVTIHDIDMDVLSTGIISLLDITLEIHEISRQDGGGQTIHKELLLNILTILHSSGK